MRVFSNSDMRPGFFFYGYQGSLFVVLCSAEKKILFDFPPHKMYNFWPKLKVWQSLSLFLPYVCLFVQSVWSWIRCQLSQLLPFVQVCPDFTQLPDFRFHPIAQIWISPNCTKPCPESTKSTFQQHDSSHLNARSRNTRIEFWKWQVF